MDIRSIIDSEDTPPTRKPSVPAPAKQEHRPSPAGFPSTQAPTYDNRRDVRPPQPSPLQTPSHNGSQYTTASPHEILRSPYQRTPSFGLNNGQYPAAQAANQSPHYGHQAPYYPQREGNSANGPSSGRSFGQSTPSQTPTASTPGSTGAYSTFQRPTSSHSIPTPNSTQHSSGFLRESPQPSNTNSRALSQPQSGQQYTSQPGTPLGPPSNYNRPGLNIHRESPGTYNHQRSLSGGTAGHHETLGLSAATRGSPSAYREPRSSVQGHSGARERERSISVSPKTRLPSLPSINQMDSMDSPLDPSSGWSGHFTPAKRKAESETSDLGRVIEPKLTRTPSRSVGVSGLLNAEPSSETLERMYRHSQTKSPSNKEYESDIEILDHNPMSRQPQGQPPSTSDRDFQHSHDHSMSNVSMAFQASASTASNQLASASPLQVSNSMIPDQAASNPLPRIPSQPEMVSSFKQAALKTSNGLINTPLPQAKISRGKRQAKRPTQESPETEAPGNDNSLLSQPVKKKPRLEKPQHSAEAALIQKPPTQPKGSTVRRVSRYEDVPIFAQSVRGPQRTKDLFENNRNAGRRGPPTVLQAPYTAAAARKFHGQANGNSSANNQTPPTNGVPVSNAKLTPASDGLLGPWEYNIANVEPLDEVIRVISDFLFLNVVMDDKVGVAPAGGGRGLGAIFEIEAKIGRIIDNNTNDRIRLPVESECVVSRSDPSIKTRFESSMTQQQHSTLNKFLNNVFLLSQGSKAGTVPLRKPRIPMTYKHTHETDTQYALSQQGTMQLPPTLAHGKKQPKVRITTDDKTGEVLAKIIKTPVADIHVYCPRTLFDWRISVNIEMDFSGDMKDLVALEKRDTNGDRKKDRVSYKHLQYQIDLTQVTSNDPENKARTHELEIEVSSEEVRRQGRLVGNQEPNDYEKLIKGFVDNVRLLARHCVQ